MYCSQTLGFRCLHIYEYIVYLYVYQLSIMYTCIHWDQSIPDIVFKFDIVMIHCIIALIEITSFMINDSKSHCPTKCTLILRSISVFSPRNHNSYIYIRPCIQRAADFNFYEKYNICMNFQTLRHKTRTWSIKCIRLGCISAYH